MYIGPLILLQNFWRFGSADIVCHLVTASQDKRFLIPSSWSSCNLPDELIKFDWNFDNRCLPSITRASNLPSFHAYVHRSFKWESITWNYVLGNQFNKRWGKRISDIRRGKCENESETESKESPTNLIIGELATASSWTHSHRAFWGNVIDFPNARFTMLNLLVRAHANSRINVAPCFRLFY